MHLSRSPHRRRSTHPVLYALLLFAPFNTRGLADNATRMVAQTDKLASTGSPTAGTQNTQAAPFIPDPPVGSATLSIFSGLTPVPGAPNPFANHPFVLLRVSYADALAHAGIAVPSGVSPYVFVANACAARTPDCKKMTDAIKAVAISAVRADVNGRGTLPGLPPGTYYLMISTRYNNQPYAWDQAVHLNPGVNALTLDLTNATPIR